MTNELRHGEQAVILDADVMALGPGQGMTHQGADGVVVFALVGRGRHQVAQFVEALPRHLQPDGLDEMAELPIHIVDPLRPVNPPRLADRLDPAPRLALPRAKEQVVARAEFQDRPQRRDRLRPQWHAMLGAGLTAGVAKAGAGEIDLTLRQLGQLHRAEAAVECQQDHRLHLVPGRLVLRNGVRDPLIDRSENLANLRGRVKPPAHERCRTAHQPLHESLAVPDGQTPALVGRVPARIAEVPYGPLGEIDAVRLSELVVDRPRLVRRPLIGKVVAGDRIQPDRAEAVLAERADLQLAPLHVGSAIIQPAQEHRVDRQRRSRSGGFRLRQRGGLRHERRGLAVVDGHRLRQRHLASDPPDAAGNAGLVAVRVEVQRAVAGELGRPVNGLLGSGHPCSVWGFRMGKPGTRDINSEMRGINKGPRRGEDAWGRLDGTQVKSRQSPAFLAGILSSSPDYANSDISGVSDAAAGILAAPRMGAYGETPPRGNADCYRVTPNVAPLWKAVAVTVNAKGGRRALPVAPAPAEPEAAR